MSDCLSPTPKSSERLDQDDEATGPGVPVRCGPERENAVQGKGWTAGTTSARERERVQEREKTRVKRCERGLADFLPFFPFFLFFSFFFFLPFSFLGLAYLINKVREFFSFLREWFIRCLEHVATGKVESTSVVVRVR